MSPKAPDYETLVAEPKLPLADRPAEVLAAVTLLPSVYGALTAIDVPAPVNWIVALVVALGPLIVSWARDGSTELDDPGDHDSEDGPPVKKGKNEKLGLAHDYGTVEE